jgi:hypothetical protein
MLALPGQAAAEPSDRPIATAVARLSFAPDATALGSVMGDSTPAWREAIDAGPRQAPAPPERSKGARIGRRIAGAAVGAVGGAFAGGYLGAAIDGDCGGCDDPGFKGFLIGFPVGGVVGGVLGGLFLFR